MEPFVTATTFATIVSLLADFSSERRNVSSSDHEDFLRWLIDTNHQELANLIAKNNATSVSIKALLGEGHHELIAKLQSLDESIAQLATGFDEFRGLANALYPDSEMSDQALSLVEQFVDSGASKVLESRYIGGNLILMIIEGGSGQLSYSDPRFIEDDLNTLVELGLFRLDHNGKGARMYLITRNAVRFIEKRRNHG